MIHQLPAFRHMRAIVSVAEMGSVLNGAYVLGRTQPVTSRAIQRLETATGGAIFERKSTGVTPTPYGTHVIKWCRALTSEAEQADRDLAAIRGVDVDDLLTAHIPPERRSLMVHAFQDGQSMSRVSERFSESRDAVEALLRQELGS